MKEFLFGLVIIVSSSCNVNDVKSKTSTKAEITVISNLVDANSEKEFAPLAKGVLIENQSYLIDFDNSSKIAFWVAYQLDSSETSGPAKRKNNFNRDKRVVGSSNKNEYKFSETGMQRGHLKPCRDSHGSIEEMTNSFLMTNIVPQTQMLNQGKWKKLESHVNNWAKEFESIYIVTGPSADTQTILNSGVRVPGYYWKALLRTYPDTSMISFYIPNSKVIEGDLRDYQISIDSLERLIDIDLFHQLPDALEEKLEIIEDESWGG